MAEERIDQQQAFDPLDMNNYRIEKLPKMQKSGFEKILQRIGAPLAILAFIAIYWLADIPFINRIDTNSETTTLTESAMKRYDQIAETQLKEFKTPDGEQVKADELTEQQQAQLTDAAHDKFIRINYAMLAIFVAAIILWISEAIPNYLTSLLVILSIVLTGVTTDKTAYAQLGHPVMWLNILSFILASMLVKTQVAKRFALWFVLKFGKNASGIMISFIVINLVLSAFISATTAKAAILLPIFMVIAAIYGATGGKNRNNWRQLVPDRFRGHAAGRLNHCRSNGMGRIQLSGLVQGRLSDERAVDFNRLVCGLQDILPAQEGRACAADSRWYGPLA